MVPITKKDIVDSLGEFYRKVIEPRFDRIDRRLEEHDKKLSDLLSHAD